ncbi:hypothetical protein HWV62_6015 [Athelia sp. TMB]|nr:hypothetical protein HWV62_6015 [Athelia sp. TMB]
MPLSKHSWSLQYIRLQLTVFLLRGISWLVLGATRAKPRLVEGVVRKRISIPSREEGRNIIVDTYQSEEHGNIKPTPVLVNMHGSGFILPSLGTNALYCSVVAARTKCIVYDIDYRKAPENPFPAAIQDVEDAVVHLGAHPDQFDASNIFLSGFSAGGNLALCTAAMLGPARIKGVAAFYSSVDCTTHDPIAPRTDFRDGHPISPWLRKLFYDSYALPGQARDDPRISSLFAPAESFPKHVYYACGDADTLHDPGAQLIKKLKDAGHGDATFVTIEHQAHGFDTGAKEGTESAVQRDQMYGDAVDMINRAIELGQMEVANFITQIPFQFHTTKAVLRDAMHLQGSTEHAMVYE